MIKSLAIATDNNFISFPLSYTIPFPAHEKLLLL